MATNYDNLTLEQAEEMTFEEWNKVPKAVVNRLYREMTGKPITVEPSNPQAAANGRKGGRKRHKKEHAS